MAAHSMMGLLSLQNIQNAGLPGSSIVRDDSLLGGCPPPNFVNDVKKFIETSSRSCWHCINKCYRCLKALDKASKICLCIAGCMFLIIVVCACAVGKGPEIDHDITINNSNHIQIDPMGIDGIIGNDNNEDMPEFITIDDLFKPAKFPVHDEINDNDIDDMNDNANNAQEPKCGEWYNVNSFDWKDKNIKRFARNKKIKISDDVSKHANKQNARIKSIDTTKNKILIENLNCWNYFYGCEQEIDFKSSKVIYFELEDLPSPSSSSSPSPSPMNHGKPSTGDDSTEILELLNKIPDIIRAEMKTNEENRLNEMNKIHEGMEDIKGQQKKFEDGLFDRFNTMDGNIKDNMNAIEKLNNRVNNIINSIAGNENITINQTMDWNKIDQYIDNKIHQHNNKINEMESTIKKLNDKFDQFDDKIESAVKKERDDQFDNLAHKIAQEIAVGMQDYPTYNDDIIRPNDKNHMYITNGDDNGQNNDKYQSSENCAYRIVNHSTAKYEIQNGDRASQFGWWFIREIFKIYDQSAIKSSNRLGECIPLLIPYNGNDPHIVIELYQPTKVKTISYYHSHSKQLGDAINAAPKEFAIFGGQHLMGPFYNLGQFTYDYYSDQHTQYFNINTNNHSETIKDDDDDDNDNIVDGIPSYIDDESITLSDEEDEDEDGIDIDDNGDIVNGTTSIENRNENIFKYIAFKLKSTNGLSDYGCIYQIKVFGDPFFST